MTLVEALRIANQRANDSARIGFTLASGFTPLHLKTFLAAQIAERTTSGRIEIESGLFGDLPGTLERLLQNPANDVAVPLEWSDLDGRLGFRGAHDWRADRLTDILSSVRMRLDQLTALLTELAQRTTVVLSLPTLSLPPMFKSPRGVADPAALELHRLLADFTAKLSQVSAVRIVDSQYLDTVSPVNTRYDAASDLRTGFPYRLPHACALAGAMAGLLRPARPMKGLITDLDNTLWSGIVGEDGVEGISWDLDHKTQAHAVYQSLLGSLSDLGVLVAVASKNELSTAQRGLQRADLIVPTAALYPIEANWGAKSDSVRRILKTWNIGSDSVVFVDDSPNELAEVAAGVPGIRCLRFPTGDDAAILQLVGELRDLFGKSTVSVEDRLRVSSLRDSGAVLPTTSDPDDFLRQAEAEITLEWNAPDSRCFELINKTNQFNLNGRRLDEAEWRRRIADPERFLLAANYSDKFSPLGRISVLTGHWQDGSPWIDAWVMSCRAFSRRIEHQILKACFERLGSHQLVFDYQPTERNAPIRELLAELTGADAHSPTTLTQRAFESRCPTLFAKVLAHDPQIRSRIAA